MKKQIVTALTAAAVLASAGTAWAGTPVAAHRGLVAAGTTENTKASVLSAVDAGYAGLEFDVRLTADGRAVLMHDPLVDRTTSCTGAVAALYLDETEACGISNYYSTMQAIAARKAWRGTVFVHVKVKLSSRAAKGLVKGARLLSNEEQRVAFMIENDAERVALVKAGWDGKDESKKHKNGAWIKGQFYGKGDVERFVNIVHTAADWNLKGYQILLPIQTPGFPGYDADVTPARVKTAHARGQKIVGFPDNPNPLAQLVSVGVDGLLENV